MKKKIIKKIVILGILALMIVAITTPMGISQENEKIIASKVIINNTNQNPEPQDLFEFAFLAGFNITFNGSIYHSGFSWTNIGIRLTWRTEYPVNITITERDKEPITRNLENGARIVTWIFLGNDGISMPYQEQSGYVDGSSIILNVYT